MHWESAADFVSMGGYGLYVWGAYGLTVGLLAFEGWLAARRNRRAVADALKVARPVDTEAQR